MMENGICPECQKPAASFHYDEGKFVCRHCYGAPPLRDTCRLFEKGHENPQDPQGSTAHVRDIKARRINTKTKELFYYTPPKTYFF